MPAIAATSILLAAAYLDAVIGLRQAALFMVGAFAGVVLYHAAFGFTQSWRVFITDRRGAGVRAQMLMLALTTAAFFPLLASGSFLGQQLRGSVSPLGVGVIAGAFMFGVGMQLGGGCASGTLFTVGGGSARMLVTLTCFILGSVIGTAHVAWWAAQPSLPATSLITAAGPWAGLAMSLIVFAAIAWASAYVERRRHGQLIDERELGRGSRWLRGPWPLVAGAIGLAVVNVATLTLSGRPWSVTGAFALWGAKWFSAVGIDVATWPYWQTAAQANALRSSVLLDAGSVMNFGIVLGALLAAMLAGRFAVAWRASMPSLIAAVVGGLLLGYGARIAYGCNIGAYFSGIASGSLHGWLWLVAAFAGNVAGTRLRPMFDLTVERRATHPLIS